MAGAGTCTAMMFSSTATTSVALNDRRGMMASAVRVYSSMTLKKRMCRRHEVTSDWKSKLTTCIGYWAVRRFCSPVPGPVRRFFRALGFTDQIFVAPEPSHPLPVQRHAVPLGLTAAI